MKLIFNFEKVPICFQVNSKVRYSLLFYKNFQNRCKKDYFSYF